jgi:hypothetical protein
MILQIVGRVHRLGQTKIQHIEIITTDHTYDQVIQAKHTSKMIGQIAAEADIFEEAEIPEEIQAIEVEHQREEAIKEFRDSKINEQAEDLIRQMLGQRCSRRQWDNLNDLTLKDRLVHDPEHTSPSGVRKRFRDLMDSAPTTPLSKRPRLAETPGRSIDPR